MCVWTVKFTHLCHTTGLFSTGVLIDICRHKCLKTNPQLTSELAQLGITKAILAQNYPLSQQWKVTADLKHTVYVTLLQE